MLIGHIFSHILTFCLFAAFMSSSLQSRSKQEDFPTTFPQVRTDISALEHDPQGLDSKHLNLVKLREHDDALFELVNSVPLYYSFSFPICMSDTEILHMQNSHRLNVLLMVEYFKNSSLQNISRVLILALY